MGYKNRDDVSKCETCGVLATKEKPIIRAHVPWGKNECDCCRTKTGNCLICGVNRNDCCC